MTAEPCSGALINYPQPSLCVSAHLPACFRWGPASWVQWVAPAEGGSWSSWDQHQAGSGGSTDLEGGGAV